MTENVRVRINLAQREFEIEGDASFVERYTDRIETMLGQLLDQSASITQLPIPAEPVATELGSFGEYFHRLPSSATEVDKMLAAGYYCQSTSSDETFTTADANRRLVEHGVKVGNASQCVKQSLTAKRVFNMGKSQYKVSVDGRRYLERLISGSSY